MNLTLAMQTDSDIPMAEYQNTKELTNSIIKLKKKGNNLVFELYSPEEKTLDGFLIERLYPVINPKDKDLISVLEAFENFLNNDEEAKEDLVIKKDPVFNFA